MLNVIPYQLKKEKMKKIPIREWREEGADAGLMNSPDRGYTNEAIGKVIWRGQDPWRIQGEKK